MPAPTIIGSLATVQAGSGLSFNDSLTLDSGPQTDVVYVSQAITRFTDITGLITLDIPLSMCNLTITPTYPPATRGKILYSFNASAPAGAYDADAIPSIVKYIPRGSSDLVVPSTVVVADSFNGINTSANQVFAYQGYLYASILAEFTFVVTVTPDHEAPSDYTLTATQTVTHPLWRGFSGTNSLDLKQYR